MHLNFLGTPKYCILQGLAAQEMETATGNVQAVQAVQAGQLAHALSCAPPLSRRGFGLSALTMLCAVPTAPSRADTPYTQARDIQYGPTSNGYVWCFRFA